MSAEVVLHCVAKRCNVLHFEVPLHLCLQKVCCNALQRVALLSAFSFVSAGSVLQCFAMCYDAFQCVALLRASCLCLQQVCSSVL